MRVVQSVDPPPPEIRCFVCNVSTGVFTSQSWETCETDGGPGDRNDGAMAAPGEEDDGIVFEVPPQLLVRHTELTRVEHNDRPRPEPAVRNGDPAPLPNDSRD